MFRSVFLNLFFFSLAFTPSIPSTPSIEVEECLCWVLSLFFLSFSLMLSLCLWVKDERALHIKSLWYNPVTQSSQSSPQTSNSAPPLSQERERGGAREPCIPARDPFQTHARQSQWILLCSVHVALWKGYFKLPCVYTHVPVKRPTHIAVYTHPSPIHAAEETPVKPLQYKHKQGLIQTQQRLAGDTDPGIDWWGRQRGETVEFIRVTWWFTAPEAIPPRFLQGLEETPMSKTAGGPRLHKPQMRLLVWVASLSFMFWQHIGVMGGGVSFSSVSWEP